MQFFFDYRSVTHHIYTAELPTVIKACYHRCDVVHCMKLISGPHKTGTCIIIYSGSLVAANPKFLNNEGHFARIPSSQFCRQGSTRLLVLPKYEDAIERLL